MKYVLFAFLAYILFQFIFRLVIPVYKTTRKFRQGFREMQEKMQEQQKTQAGPNSHFNPGSQPKPTAKAGEYIEFEELSDSK